MCWLILELFQQDSFLEYLFVALVFLWILICCHCGKWLHLESDRVTLGVQGWRNRKVWNYLRGKSVVLGTVNVCGLCWCELLVCTLKALTLL